jgi:hypothetical protein
MQVRYLGFDHIQNARAFHFEVLQAGTPRKQFTVTADVRLFPQHQVGIQDGPELCALKLGSNLSDGLQAAEELTTDDLSAYTRKRDAEAAAKKTVRKSKQADGHSYSPSANYI